MFLLRAAHIEQQNNFALDEHDMNAIRKRFLGFKDSLKSALESGVYSHAYGYVFELVIERYLGKLSGSNSQLRRFRRIQTDLNIEENDGRYYISTDEDQDFEIDNILQVVRADWSSLLLIECTTVSYLSPKVIGHYLYKQRLLQRELDAANRERVQIVCFVLPDIDIARLFRNKNIRKFRNKYNLIVHAPITREELYLLTQSLMLEVLGDDFGFGEMINNYES